MPRSEAYKYFVLYRRVTTVAALLRLLVGVQVGVVLVLEHGLDVAPEQGQQQRHPQAGRHQVEEGGLGVLVHVHHEDREQQARQVGWGQGVERHTRNTLCVYQEHTRNAS